MSRSGFVLVPVVLGITLIALIAFLLTREASLDLRVASGALQADRGLYVAEAGFAHQRWLVDGSNCTGYTNLSSEPFGSHSYSTTVAPTSGSPVAINATAALADGTVGTYSRSDIAVYYDPDSAVLQPAGRDAWINSGNPTQNRGGDQVLEVDGDTKRALLWFDLASAIPVGARVTDAQLGLHLQGLGPNVDVNVYRVTRAWTEGGVTWNTTDGSTAWTTPGGDYEGAASATTTLTGGGDYTWDVTALVDGWARGSILNEGFLLRGEAASAAVFSSSDHGTASEHPSLAVTYTAECGTGCPSASTKMYWVDLGQIRRADLDGSNVEDLVTTGILETQGIDLDLAAGKMYWTDQGTYKIQRANLDGTVVEDLVDLGTGKKAGIALDVAGGKMYYTDVDLKEVLRANLDGTNIEALVSGLSEPRGIALDVAAGKLYWTDQGNELIQRANLDGSNIETLVIVRAVGIELDLIAGKMYWTDPGSGKIQRSNLDGTVVEDLVTGLSESNGITLDVLGCRMYWTDKGTGKIQRAKLDGSGVADLVTTGLAEPRGIALD